MTVEMTVLARERATPLVIFPVIAAAQATVMVEVFAMTVAAHCSAGKDLVLGDSSALEEERGRPAGCAVSVHRQALRQAPYRMHQ